MSILSADPTLAPYLALILFGFLPSEIWRMLAAVMAKRIDEDSELFLFVRSVATVLLVGVVVKIVFLPSRELAAAPVWARCAAFAMAAAAFFRRAALGVRGDRRRRGDDHPVGVVVDRLKITRPRRARRGSCRRGP